MTNQKTLTERAIQKRLERERHQRNLDFKQSKKAIRRKDSGLKHYRQNSQFGNERSKWQSSPTHEPILLPETLDLISNFETTALVTRVIRRLALKEKKAISLDFEKLKVLKPDALLLLLAEMHRCRLIHGSKRVTGTYPENPKIERMLDATGFFNLLGVIPRVKTKKNNYPMEYVDFVSSQYEVKGTVKAFREQLLGTSIVMTPQARSKLYRVISEAMLNVSYHAYPKGSIKTNPQRGRWWLAGHVNRRSKELMIMFCDLGVGIPATLPKLYSIEVIQSLLALLPGIRPNDGQMIQAAMDLGRSRTGLTNRGKGLNDLRSFVDQAGAGELHIFSGHGHYCYSPVSGETIKNYRVGVGGTVIKWTVPMEAVTNWAGEEDEQNIDDD